MCEYLGYEVVALQRTRIMHIELGNLPVGKWRELTPKEVQKLMAMLETSKMRLFNIKIREK